MSQQTTVATTKNAYDSRLPCPANAQEEISPQVWQVLTNQIFPAAKTAESILMAWNYCKARRLDILKKPVSIVPMWNSQLRKEVETVWPGIGEIQITAARTGKYAGMDNPVFGPDITRTFKGEINSKDESGSWQKQNLEVTVTFPEWCSVTVYRMVEGVRCPFSEPVYWLEAYAKRGKTEVPNDMWAKRPRGQFIKMAKAFSLRAAFPEEGEYVAEEMEGKIIDAGGVVIEGTAKQLKPVPESKIKPVEPVVVPSDPETGEITPHTVILLERPKPYSPQDKNEVWSDYGQKIIAAYKSAPSTIVLWEWMKANTENNVQLQNDWPKLFDRVTEEFDKMQIKLKLEVKTI